MTDDPNRGAEPDPSNEEPDAEDSPAMAAQEEARRELRRNMLRSIITEPLLSRINENPTGVFDVIIALNELYQGGLAGALEKAQERAREWGRALRTTLMAAETGARAAAA